MEDWAFSILEALNANQQLDMLQVLGPKYGIDGENLMRLMAGAPELRGAEQPRLHAHRHPEPPAPRPHHRAHRARLAQGRP